MGTWQFFVPFLFCSVSLTWFPMKKVASPFSVVKNPTAMQETQETQVQFLHQEDPLEKEKAIHSSILDWEIPRTEKPRGLQSIESQRVGHDWATEQQGPILAPWRRFGKIESPESTRCPFWRVYILLLVSQEKSAGKETHFSLILIFSLYYLKKKKKPERSF